MNRLFIVTLVIMFFISAGITFALQKAVTEDGKEVILKDDNTWEYAKESKTADSDFRKAKWGMSKEEVIKSEGSQPARDEDNFIGYAGKIAGLDCGIAYVFTNDKLTRAKYILFEKHSNLNDHINDFINLRKLLTKKYGEPSKKDEIWRNDLYKDQREQWGMAVGAGHLVYYAEWNTESTEISMMLSGDNFKIINQVEYASRKLKELENKATEDETLDDL